MRRILPILFAGMFVVRLSIAQRPVSVELLVNASATEQLPETSQIRAARRGSGILIPAARSLSQFRISDGPSRVTVLDLERRRVAFEQVLSNRDDWNRSWSKLEASLAEADPDKIDLPSLEDRQYNAQFFLSQIQNRLADSGDARTLKVLIILSELMVFGKTNTKPLPEAEISNYKIFYIRLRPLTPIALDDSHVDAGDGSRRRPATATLGDEAPPTPGLTPWDQLFDLVKPLHPRLFEISTLGQLRKAIARMQREITLLAK